MARLSMKADQTSLVMKMHVTCVEKGCPETLLAELAPSTPLGNCRAVCVQHTSSALAR